MTIIEQLENPTFKVTKTDRIIIEYIKNNLETFAYKTISEVAKDISIAEATITRFTRKIGFSGLQDFKVSLTKEISSANKKSIIDSNILNDEPVLDSAKKILSSNINTLESTVDILNAEDLNKSVQLIMNSKKVYFIGLGYSGIIAEDSSYKFMRIGTNCINFSCSHTMAMMAAIMGEEDLMVVISHSGETEEIIKTVELAKKNKVKIISITSNRESRLKDSSDICIPYISKETTLEAGSISSKLAQIFIIDVIYTQVVKEKFNESIDIKVKTTDAIKVLSKTFHEL